MLLKDRAFCSYADLVLIQNHQADAVVRNQGRKTLMRRGKRLGSSDHLITWSKPKNRPQGLSKEEFDALPKTLTLREVHYYICIPGFRTKQVTLITTLLDAKVYSWQELLKIYEWRWQVELDLKHIKSTLGMEILRSKTPEMVWKEIYVYLLAYNLLLSGRQERLGSRPDKPCHPSTYVINPSAFCPVPSAFLDNPEQFHFLVTWKPFNLDYFTEKVSSSSVESE